MARVLVIEDEEDITAFIKRGLVLKGYAVDVASSGPEGLDIFRETPPDVVLLDLMLPGIDGVEVCKRIRAVSEDVPIIMLTALDSVSDKVRGLEAGADDYITKPFSFDELSARLAAALRRRVPREEILEVGELTINPASREVSRVGRVVNLTNREYELLEYLARNAGKVVKKQTLFERVWGYDFDLDSDVIKVYIRYLRRKLNEDGESDMIHSVRGVGYMLKP
ncbi:MAG: response regulator transcription factor [Chloroflexi bacterium]|nr:response regulator transcription factor [Chloroflexota bacterium]